MDDALPVQACSSSELLRQLQSDFAARLHKLILVQSPHVQFGVLPARCGLPVLMGARSQRLCCWPGTPPEKRGSRITWDLAELLAQPEIFLLAQSLLNASYTDGYHRHRIFCCTGLCGHHISRESDAISRVAGGFYSRMHRNPSVTSNGRNTVGIDAGLGAGFFSDNATLTA
jgi:hypothetical protein